MSISISNNNSSNNNKTTFLLVPWRRHEAVEPRTVVDGVVVQDVEALAPTGLRQGQHGDESKAETETFTSEGGGHSFKTQNFHKENYDFPQIESLLIKKSNKKNWFFFIPPPPRGHLENNKIS